MRTAVVRVDVDPRGELTGARLEEGLAALEERAAAAGAGVVSRDVLTAPAGRRVLQLLVDGDDAAELRETATRLCAEAFGTEPMCGAVTYISRGSDDDALGVLAGLGVTGRVTRTEGTEGWDVVHVEVPERELERVPESRVQTALEAALNCEVHIVVGG